MPKREADDKIPVKEGDDQKLDPAELLVEIDGKPVKPQSQLIRSKSNLYQGDKSVYDIYRDALSARHFKEMLQEYQNSQMPTSELFGETGAFSVVSSMSQMKSRDSNKKNIRMVVQGAGLDNSEQASAIEQPEPGSLRSNLMKIGNKFKEPSSSSKQDSAKPEPASKDPLVKRDPKRLVPIRVDDRTPPETLKAKKKPVDPVAPPTSHRSPFKSEAKRLLAAENEGEQVPASKSTKKTKRSNSRGQDEAVEKDFEIRRSKASRDRPELLRSQEGVNDKSFEELAEEDEKYVQVPVIKFREILDDEENQRGNSAEKTVNMSDISGIERRRDESDGDMEEFEVSLKLVVLGESTVGKSNLVTRFVSNEFAGESSPTHVVDMKSKVSSVDKKNVRTLIYDLPGQEKLKDFGASNYSGSDGAVIVYDVTQKASFEKVKSWVTLLKKNIDLRTAVVMLVGNKSDLEQNRKVTEGQGRDLADKLGFLFAETSAMKNSKKEVPAAFIQLIKAILIKKNEESIQLSRGSSGKNLKDNSREIAYSDDGGRMSIHEEDADGEDSLMYIEDERKREEIRAYRQKKRDAIAEERKIDGNGC